MRIYTVRGMERLDYRYCDIDTTRAGGYRTLTGMVVRSIRGSMKSIEGYGDSCDYGVAGVRALRHLELALGEILSLGRPLVVGELGEEGR